MDITAINRNVEPLVAAASVAPVATPRGEIIVQAVRALNATEMIRQDNALVFQKDR